MKKTFTYFLCSFAALLLTSFSTRVQGTTEQACCPNPMPQFNGNSQTGIASTAHPRKFVFKTNNPSPKASDISNAFTTEDAANLRQFFQLNAQPIECDAQQLKVIAYKTLNDNTNDYTQKPLDITQQLANQGYIVTQLECSEYKVVFNLQKNKDGKIAMKPASVQNVATNQAKPCDACGNVKLSEQATQKILETLNPNEQKSLDLGFDE